MRRPRASDIVLKALGLLLLTAAVLKAHELLTVPVANKDVWSWRPFLIFQVEFELALGVWLVSGVFKRLAWLAATCCFGMFCCVTLYKGLTGAASCGCFGTVHVNPWVTLMVVDLPGVAGLLALRPEHLGSRMRRVWALITGLLGMPFQVLRGKAFLSRSVLATVRGSLAGVTSAGPLATGAVGLALLAISTPILALNTPPRVTSRYEVLEPETWVGKELPILEHIDIGEQIKTGNYLVTFYHHDCPDCTNVLPICEQMAKHLKASGESLAIAVIEVPPYGQGPLTLPLTCALGRLSEAKDWFITTPAAVLLEEGKVRNVWERTAVLDLVATTTAEPGRGIAHCAKHEGRAG